jgi:hypothetical protein
MQEPVDETELARHGSTSSVLESPGCGGRGAAGKELRRTARRQQGSGINAAHVLEVEKPA